jgi:hypothetical protein
MKKLASLIIVLTTAILIVGCSGSSNDSESDQVADTLISFAEDFRDQDWTAVCDSLSTQAQDQIDESGKQILEYKSMFENEIDVEVPELSDPPTCQETFAFMAVIANGEESQLVTEADIEEIKTKLADNPPEISEDGKTATVKVSLDDSDQTSTLIKENGEWKVNFDEAGTN